MAQRPHGIDPAELPDDDLEREVTHLHETRHSTFLDGSADALEEHTERMLALEEEFLRRFPERSAPSPLRVRASRREMSGQD